MDMCTYPGCKTRARFGVIGGAPEFCSGHAPCHYINLRTTLCTVSGCVEPATYCEVVRGRKMKPTYCKFHAPPTFISSTKSYCTVAYCFNIAEYGIPCSSRPTHCASHVPHGFTIECTTKCRFQGCNRRIPGAGLSQVFCSDHCAPDASQMPIVKRYQRNYTQRIEELASIASATPERDIEALQIVTDAAKKYAMTHRVQRWT